MPKLAIYNINGKETGTIELPEKIFGPRVNMAVLHQAVVMYQANQRQGNASTKERGAVSGGGRKPWRQKGTGRARHGSIRSPLWHKGGVVFGPHPRDFSYSVPKKVRVAALRESLNDKFQSEGLMCVDEITVSSGKTKDFVKILSALKLDTKVLAILDGSDSKALLASRNVSRVNFSRAQDVNAVDVLNNKKILLTQSALKTLLDRIQ